MNKRWRLLDPFVMLVVVLYAGVILIFLLTVALVALGLHEVAGPLIRGLLRIP